MKINSETSRSSTVRFACEASRLPERTGVRDSELTGPFKAVVVFTFILLLSPQNWFPPLAHLRIAFVSAALAFAMLLWDRWRRGEPLMEISREVIVALMLPVWAFVTMPLSFWPGGSATLLFSLYIKALMIFWLLASIVTSYRRLRFLTTLLILCSVPLAITGAKNFESGTVKAGRIIGYEAGLTTNPNDLALMLNLLIPFAIALFLSAEKSWLRILCLGILCIDVVGVIVTFSRAGFLGLATIGVIYFVKLARRPGKDRVWAFVILALVIFSLPLLPSKYVDRLATVTDIKSDPTGSSQARWRDNVAAFRFVVAHPGIGAGIGMDTLALNQERGTLWLQVHNVYLQYAVDLGVPGLLLFLILFTGVYRAARFARRSTADVPELRNLFLLAEAVQVSLTVFAVAGFFHPSAYHFYFYYIAGLALGVRAAARTALDLHESTEVVPAVPRWPLANAT